MLLIILGQSHFHKTPFSLPLPPPLSPVPSAQREISKCLLNEKKKCPGKSKEHSSGILNGNTISNWTCFLQKNHISWKLRSRRPDGKAWENSELFLLKPFPPEGPESKRKAFATNNWASVRGCGWHVSKASVGLWAVSNANIRERLVPGKCAHPETDPLAVRRRSQVSHQCRLLKGERPPGSGARRLKFSAGIWVSDQGFW